VLIIEITQYFKHYNINKIIKSIPIKENISINNIPYELRNYIDIIKIGPSKSSNYILEKYLKLNNLNNLNKKYLIFDELNFKGGYLPLLHTDTEWNYYANNGFQFWYLLYNNYSTKKGNMFIFYNKYIIEKYKDIGIGFRLNKNKKNINIIKNSFSEEFLEEIPIDIFLKNTFKYYLDIEPYECFIFKKNVMHMSDYRTTFSYKRKAINFRVLIKENGKIKIKENESGYVNDNFIMNK
jgi:hypothetical protein